MRIGTTSRSFALIAASVLVIALGVGACGGGGDDGNPKLTIGHNVWIGYGPLYIAEAKGYFEEEGVDVDLSVQNDLKQAWALLAAGRLDGLMTTLDNSVSFHIEGADYANVLGVDFSNGGDGLGASREIASVEDLAGKSVAWETGASGQFLLEVVLEENGLSTDDVEHVELLGSDGGAALLAGQVDAAMTYEPYLGELRDAADTDVLFDSADRPGFIVDSMVMNRDVIEGEPEAVQGVVNAWYKAVDYYDAHPKESIQIMADGLGGYLKSPEEVKNSLPFVEFLNEAENKEFFTDSPDAPEPNALLTVTEAVDILTPALDLTGIPLPEDFLDVQFVQGKQ